MFVCLYVSTATKEGAKRPDCAWLTLLKRNDQMEMERTFKSFIQVWTFRNSVIFFRVSRKKKKQDTFNSKNEKLQFLRNYDFAKTWNREENGSSQNTNFSQGHDVWCAFSPHTRSSVLDQPFSLLFYFEYWTLNEIKMEFVFTIENKNVVENVIKGTWKMKN